ncbi:hydroxyphenylacetyl-CoA thioesterase PaaI [Brucellaceae bacterium C25G]
MKKVADMTPQELAEASAHAMWAGDKASQDLGMELVSIAPGSASLSMTLTPTMSNGHGNCQGGFIFTLADSAFAYACNSYNQLVVAQNCSISFISPGRIGDRLTAIAREVSRRGRSGIYDIQVFNQDGEHIAEFRGLSRSVKGTHVPE